MSVSFRRWRRRYLVKEEDDKGKNDESADATNDVPPKAGLGNVLRSIRKSFGLDLVKIN